MATKPTKTAPPPRPVLPAAFDTPVEEVQKEQLEEPIPPGDPFDFGLSISTPDPGKAGVFQIPEEVPLMPPIIDKIPPPIRVDEAHPEIMAKINLLKARLRVDPDAKPSEVLEAVLAGLWTRKAVILMPNNQPMNMRVVFGLLAQIKKQPWLGFEYECDTVIQRARNLLADRFLKSEAQWSLWLDSDMIAPFGHPGFFYKTLGLNPAKVKPEFLQFNILDRLIAANKSIVGAVYQQRNPAAMGARMVIQPHLHPKGARDIEIVERLHREGPFNEVIPVGYVATGCALIHRSVYEDIKKNHPERQPEKPGEPYDFFGHDVGTGGEDISFCNLAKEAGHQSYLDCGAICAHLGTNAYFPDWR